MRPWLRLLATFPLLSLACGGAAGSGDGPTAPIIVVGASDAGAAPTPPPSSSAPAPVQSASGPRRGGDTPNDEVPQLAEPASAPDPAQGSFSLAEATAGLPPGGALIATIRTSMGDLTCRLYEDKAKVSVANFVGLARGLRPWKEPGGAWVKRAAYDGTTFHRVIPGFMIQGGDPKGDGSGEPGYVIPDEIWPGAKHDRIGLLCAANRGPNTNGMQFFVTAAKTPHLDGAYTIFGECTPSAVVTTIASVPRDRRDRPLTDVAIHTIEISRASAKAGAAPKP